MAIEAVEQYRRLVVDALFGSEPFCNSWVEIYLPEIERVFAGERSADAVRRVGAEMYRVFREAHVAQQRSAARGQSQLSRAGGAWERLVCWYLNLGLLGTTAVVVKRGKHLPKSVYDALTVTIQNRKTNSESDLVAIDFAFSGAVPLPEPRDRLGALSKRLEQSLDISKTKVGVIQCKTNWNDNSQVVMLWNAIYGTAFDDSPISGINLGVNGVKLHDFRDPFYTFVTVPSQRPASFRPSTLAVTRLGELSGGRFWAWETTDGVADNISGIFRDSRTFGSATRDWTTVLTRELQSRSLPEYRVPCLVTA